MPGGRTHARSGLPTLPQTRFHLEAVPGPGPSLALPAPALKMELSIVCPLTPLRLAGPLAPALRQAPGRSRRLTVDQPSTLGPRM